MKKAVLKIPVLVEVIFWDNNFYSSVSIDSQLNVFINDDEDGEDDNNVEFCEILDSQNWRNLWPS